MPYQAEIKRAVERVVIDQLMELAANAGMPQVRALATLALEKRATMLSHLAPTADVATRASSDSSPAISGAFSAGPPPRWCGLFPRTRRRGAPIGEPAQEWLDMVAPACSWTYRYWQ